MKTSLFLVVSIQARDILIEAEKKDFQISSNNGARLIIFLGPTDSEATCLVEPYNPYSCVLSKLNKDCQRNTVDSGC